MPTQTDRLYGLNTALAFKAPCRVATTANITLSGEQTIDGIAVVENDRVVVKDQTTATANGIYVAAASTWVRAADFDGNRDATDGTLVTVRNGTVNADTAWRVVASSDIVFGTTSLTFEPALFSDASSLSFLQAGTGAVARTAQSKLRESISPEDFGAVGDGVTDDTAAIKAMADAIANGTVVEFAQNKTYLVAYANAGNSDDYGKKVMYLSGKRDVTIKGNGATIKCVSHDIATNGGLMFLWATGCPRLTVEGFYFDMTFTGSKNSASFYPFCGAIILNDPQTGAVAQTALCSDAVVRDCRFKLYHLYGQYATTAFPYSGDGNNGFKVFAIFASGDAAATAYDNQNRNITIENITFKDGHNGYGVWVWAYNNSVISKITSEAWVAKYSTSAGVFGGGGVPMIRYHQFYNFGLSITDCHFRAKPCDLRTVSGFEGNAVFAHVGTNLTGDYSHGKSVVSGNVITLGNGDAVNSLYDYGVYAWAYGDVIVSDNQFDGITTTTNAYAGQHIRWNSESEGQNGKASLLIEGNIFGIANSYNDSIVIANGSNTSDYDRRLKNLTVTDNISFSQLQTFLDMTGNSVKTYLGVRASVVQGNTVIGTYNTVWSSASTNSRAFVLGANQSTDMLVVKDNIVKDKYYLALGSDVHASANVLVQNNRMAGVTTTFIGGSLVDFQSKSGTFTPIMKGSGTAGTPTYTYQSGRYTRTENRCFVELVVIITAAGGATSNWLLNLNDIPYTPKTINASHQPSYAVTHNNLIVGAGKQFAALGLDGSKDIGLYLMDSDAGGALAAYTVAADAAFSLYVSGSFEVA